jgi:hypothetical protein
MSSRITGIVATQFTAQGGQAIVQQLHSMGQATGAFYNRLQDTSRQSSVLTNQWRAMATTIRYAIAGQAIFGLTRMVGQLKDVQQQLGLIQSLGTQPGPGGTSIGFSNADVNKLGDQLQKVALTTITPINDINNAAINLLSTIQDVNPGDVPKILTDIAEAAKLSQTPIEDLTQAATTMNIAFGRANSAANIGQFSRMWNAMIGLAPGGIRAAPELAKQLPNVSTVFQQGLSPNVPAKTAQAQMMSLVLGSLRFGATPSTAMRGLAYFLQSLETPASAKAKTALEGIGITPQSVRRTGINATTMKFLRHISGNMTKTQLGQLQAIPEDQLEGMNALPGVAPNQMAFLRTSLGRIHAVRTAIVLASQLKERGGVASLQEDLDALLGYQNDEIKDTHSLSVGWQKFRDRSKLAEAANALNVLSLQVAQTVEPILNLAATGITKGVTVAQHHRRATEIAVGATAVGAALLGGRRFLSRGAGGAVGGIQAIRSATSTTPPSGTIADPIYVRVIGDIFGTGGLRKPGPVTTVEEGTKTAGKGWIEKVGARAGLASTVASKAAVPVTLAVLGAAAIKGGLHAKRTISEQKEEFSHHGFFGNVIRGANPWTLGKGIGSGAVDDWHKLIGLTHGGAWGGGGGGNPAASAALRRAQDIWNKNGNTVSGIRNDNIREFTNARGVHEIAMTIMVKHPDGTETKKRVHIPVKLWETKPAPTAKGSPNGRR